MAYERERKVLTFNMENPSHRKAWSILEERKGSTDFIVECILAFDETKTLPDILQQMQELKEMLSGKLVTLPEPEEPEEPEEEQNEMDMVPDMLFALMK